MAKLGKNSKKVSEGKQKVGPGRKAPENEPGGNKPKKKGTKGKVKQDQYNPLEAMSPKELRQQAMKTVRAIYKPAFKQLGREEQRMLSISSKRKNDNAYYLNWLDKKSQQLQAHQDAANAAILKAGADATAETGQAYQDLRADLIETGESTPGVVSNVGDATAFDVSGQASRDQALIESARNQTQGQLGAIEDASQMAAASNFAFIAGQEAKRVGDQWEALSKLGDAKQELRLSRAADAAKEISRLFDREIEKAQIRGQMSAAETQAMLEAKRFGLDVSKLELDREQFDFEQTESNRKFGLEKKKHQETVRWHNIEAQLKKADNKAEQRKANQKVTAIIQEGISTIASNPNLQRRLSKNPNAVKQRLMKILGSATAASAAVELVGQGKLNPTTRQDLRALGYIVPPKWR